MKYTDIADPVFREAVEAISKGETELLRQLLTEHPDLINKRTLFPGGGYFERPFLLWFVADNPIRNGKLPGNIMEVMQLLIQFLGNVNPASRQEQLDYALGLVDTGRIPRESGFQIAMMDALIDAGATPGEGVAALAHGNIDAARHLIERGGNRTLTAAVCFDELKEVEQIAIHASQDDLLTALTAAAFYGKPAMISLLLAAGASPDGYPKAFFTHATPLHQAVYSGSLECVQLLVTAGSNMEATDKVYNGTPLGWASHMHTENTSDSAASHKYKLIAKYLQKNDTAHL